LGSRQPGCGCGIVVHLELGRWDHPQFAVQPAVVEPVDVVHRRVLDDVEARPGLAAVADQFGFVQPLKRLGERVVVRVAPRADRCRDARLGCQVVGVDLSPISLAHARTQAQRDDLTIDYRQGDYRSVRVPPGD